MTTSGNNKPPIKQSFVNKNLVAIVMIPAIIGIHYGWGLIQQNEAFVKEEERKDLPTYTAFKYMWNRITDSFSRKDTDSKN